MICTKAKALHIDLLHQHMETSAPAEEFKVNRGWFENFKVRSGIHSVARHGEATSSHLRAAEDFAMEFREDMVSEGYLPQQVFNCNETGLFWKRIPKRTFIMEEETNLPGHKPIKDRLTLLFCANTSGDLKNLQAFKKHKERLDILWQSNIKAWVTCIQFVQWVNLFFGPAVKQYLLEKNLSLKVLLLMDNAPAHHPGLKEDLLEGFQFIKVMSLPPTTPVLQPIDQQNLNSASCNLWTGCVVTPDASAPAPVCSGAKNFVCVCGRTVGLEIEEVSELVEGHDHELSTQDLLGAAAAGSGATAVSFEEEEMREKEVSTMELREACVMCAKLQTFVQWHHLDKALTQNHVNNVDYDIMSWFKGMLKKHQRQQII
ncbi:hypothetical protein JRQ81_003153 [Phrynocephalus forsythii]|uniref:DDE-1 domain-containing protein n=1 Tax=Phrynocephalus forsythii TaxID=171643 RepID=A0A9Q0XK10_9SAUR|nr:hypothetical protein JRQ81_003153 [Phrynocephalus forsythii]